jgi:hypothetical protein
MIILMQCNSSKDNIGLHVTENPTSNTSISLHLYSPPYFECTSGTTLIPVVYCSSVSSCDKRRGDVLPPTQLKHQNMLFSNFQTLVDLLREEFHKNNNEEDVPLNSRIKKLLESLQFHPK